MNPTPTLRSHIKTMMNVASSSIKHYMSWPNNMPTGFTRIDLGAILLTRTPSLPGLITGCLNNWFILTFPSTTLREGFERAPPSTTLRVLFYTCGPDPFMRMVQFTLRVMGFQEEQLRKRTFCY